MLGNTKKAFLRNWSYKCYESNVYTGMCYCLFQATVVLTIFPWREGYWYQVSTHFGGRVKCFEEWRTVESSIIPLSLSCLVPLARLSPVPEDVGVITGVERTWAPDIRDMSPRGRSPLVTSAGAPRWRRVIRLSLSARDIGLCAPWTKNKENMMKRCKV